jgi:hypothetical protein
MALVGTLVEAGPRGPFAEIATVGGSADRGEHLRNGQLVARQLEGLAEVA